MTATASLLAQFTPTRVLSSSTSTPSVYLLGTIDGQDAIVHVLKTNFNVPQVPQGEGDKEPEGIDAWGSKVREMVSFDKVLELEDNDIYRWASAWWPTNRPHPDVKLTLIYPATELHIRKYEAQQRVVVVETPEVYERVVRPYIESIPASRIQWVYNILNHEKEADKILYEDPDPQTGFLILPDLKWDQKTLATLYLSAIVFDKSIRSVRDLAKHHLPLLYNIQHAAERVVARYGLAAEAVRMFVHYQPSYYHFHVHIVALENEAYVGLHIGKAHLLNDLISLLELSDEQGPSLCQRMTWTYVVGREEALGRALCEAGVVKAG
ncbi:hypothetical protein NliqN6_2343 [Naganishia liquefaciens]|uniref:m7GpppX diphosphatase n=1 Tax=Naganishia liquefaciens TaxID=104408 RepID=A0A8H3TS30_9TREE|nr:hypothetical protein NliqN6_2343 [Naganishia liquefaciens]